MIELETPRIDEIESTGNLSRFEVNPLQAGYGVTLGNALRRVLLSSLEGAAVTSVQVAGVFHEFSTIENVKEDVTQIVLNVKKLRLRSFARHPVTLKLVKRGAGPVTAADIGESADVEIVNPELVLLTLDSDEGSIEMDLTVESGVGYRPAEHTEEMPIGVIPVDAIFSPVRRVNYTVEKTRVGQMTNYDRLSLDIETDGTTTAQAALSQAADILVREFGRFAEIGRPAVAAGGGGRPGGAPPPPGGADAAHPRGRLERRHLRGELAVAVRELGDLGLEGPCRERLLGGQGREAHDPEHPRGDHGHEQQEPAPGVPGRADDLQPGSPLPGGGRALRLRGRERGHQRSPPAVSAVAAVRSTARRRAERARGLAATSVSEAGSARRVSGRATGSRPQPHTGRSGGQMQPRAASANTRLATRSSREW
jgi:DNA-directed RNA polymerase alpha subunit